MSEKEKEIMETFGKLIPNMSESEKSYLLGLGEGMAIKVGEWKQGTQERELAKTQA
jgi:hypothetical protein